MDEMTKALQAEDERQAKLHELLETIREQIRLEVLPEHRPEGLFENIQNAVYAMRGRTPLMNDAVITSRLAAQPAAPVGENISKDSTLYVERSMVRIGAIGSSDETMLEYVDSLPVFTAADFAAPPPSPPEVSGEIVLIPTADQIEPILEDYFAGFALEARKRCAQRIFDLCVVMSGLPIAKSDNRIANPGNTEP